MLHRGELGQESPALRLAAERIDHPGGHVVDRDVRRGRSAALRQFLEDDCGIEPGQRRAADVVTHGDGAEAERRRLAQCVDRKDFAFVPFARERHHLLAREGAGDGGKRALLLGKIEVHPALTPWFSPA